MGQLPYPILFVRGNYVYQAHLDYNTLPMMKTGIYSFNIFYFRMLG